MVIRIEMLNGEEDGEEKREEKGKFWWGNFGSPCPFFFTRVPPTPFIGVAQPCQPWRARQYIIVMDRSQ